jgi:hypothetical protein
MNGRLSIIIIIYSALSQMFPGTRTLDCVPAKRGNELVVRYSCPSPCTQKYITMPSPFALEISIWACLSSPTGRTASADHHTCRETCDGQSGPAFRHWNVVPASRSLSPHSHVCAAARRGAHTHIHTKHACMQCAHSSTAPHLCMARFAICDLSCIKFTRLPYLHFCRVLQCRSASSPCDHH